MKGFFFFLISILWSKWKNQQNFIFLKKEYYGCQSFFKPSGFFSVSLSIFVFIKKNWGNFFTHFVCGISNIWKKEMKIWKWTSISHFCGKMFMSIMQKEKGKFISIFKQPKMRKWISFHWIHSMIAQKKAVYKEVGWHNRTKKSFYLKMKINDQTSTWEKNQVFQRNFNPDEENWL